MKSQIVIDEPTSAREKRRGRDEFGDVVLVRLTDVSMRVVGGDERLTNEILV